MDKIIKYLDKSEETINKLINLKRELKEESPETQRYIFYDYKQNQRFSFNGNSSYSPITKNIVNCLMEISCVNLYMMMIKFVFVHIVTHLCLIKLYFLKVNGKRD